MNRSQIMSKVNGQRPAPLERLSFSYAEAEAKVVLVAFVTGTVRYSIG